jgi:hypothetical protein
MSANMENVSRGPVGRTQLSSLGTTFNGAGHDVPGYDEAIQFRSAGLVQTISMDTQDCRG